MEADIIQCKNKIDYTLYLLVEMWGTGCLVFAVMMSSSSTPYVVPIVLLYAIAIGDKYSGASYNGAITIALYLQNMYKLW